MLGGLAGEEVMCNDVTSGSSDDVGKAKKYIQMLMNVGAFGFDKLLPRARLGRLSLEEFPVSEKKLVLIEDYEFRLLNEAFEKAKAIIEENKNVVQTIYKQLKEKEKLSKKEVEEILKKLKESGGLQ